MIARTNGQIRFLVMWCAVLMACASAANAAVSIPEARALADDSGVELTLKVVTHAGVGFFYIQEDTGSGETGPVGGIRVVKALHGLAVVRRDRGVLRALRTVRGGGDRRRRRSMHYYQQSCNYILIGLY